MEGIYFLHQIKHNSANDTWDKGIVINKNGGDRANWESALQSYHAYLGAYAYGNNADTDYVQCEITDMSGVRRMWERWEGAKTEPAPAPEQEI